MISSPYYITGVKYHELKRTFPMSTYVGLLIYICLKKGIVLEQSQSDRKVMFFIIEESLREMLQNSGYSFYY